MVRRLKKFKKLPTYYNPFSTHYLVLDEAVLIEPDVTHVLHFWGHHHSPRFHLLHSALDGQEVTSLFVLDAEKVALLQEKKKKNSKHDFGYTVTDQSVLG